MRMDVQAFYRPDFGGWGWAAGFIVKNKKGQDVFKPQEWADTMEEAGVIIGRWRESQAQGEPIPIKDGLDWLATCPYEIPPLTEMGWNG